MGLESGTRSSFANESIDQNCIFQSATMIRVPPAGLQRNEDGDERLQQSRSPLVKSVSIPGTASNSQNPGFTPIMKKAIRNVVRIMGSNPNILKRYVLVGDFLWLITSPRRMDSGSILSMRMMAMTKWKNSSIMKNKSEGDHSIEKRIVKYVIIMKIIGGFSAKARFRFSEEDPWKITSKATMFNSCSGFKAIIP